MMKTFCRWFTILMCAVLLTSFTFSVSADTHNFDLKELGMSMDIPDNMTVYTRENSTHLQEGIYLEATDASLGLSITVSMIQNDKTEEIYSFSNMSSSAIEEYKTQLLENEAYIECTKGTYGDVPFLDFSQKYTTDQGVTIYGKQSVTLVNGMNISVTSQSMGESFTSEELAVIKGCLDSIHFKQIKTDNHKVSFWTILLWIVVVIVLLFVAFLVLSYFMGKRSADKKRAARIAQKKKADYDVLSRAENAKKPSAAQGTVGGYKSSSEYFENDFDLPMESNGEKVVSDNNPSTVTPVEKAVRSTSKAFTHLGYFIQNLRREINGNKSRENKSGRKSAKKKSRDYDVFNDR